MRNFIVPILLFSVAFASAQDFQSVQEEINRTLWKPFKAAFETLNETALNDLYADEVLRVTPNGIDTDNQFKAGNIKRFADNRERSTSIQLDFWFDSRHTNADTSYEVGFYRMKLSNQEGENSIYGQFHIVLKKENGTWRITQDWDTTSINGNTITAADFEKLPPIQFE